MSGMEEGARKKKTNKANIFSSVSLRFIRHIIAMNWANERNRTISIERERIREIESEEKCKRESEIERERRSSSIREKNVHFSRLSPLGSSSNANLRKFGTHRYVFLHQQIPCTESNATMHLHEQCAIHRKQVNYENHIQKVTVKFIWKNNAKKTS